MKRVFVLLFILVFFLAGGLFAGGVSFGPTDDVWVKDGEAVNRGTLDTLRVRGLSRYSFLKFTVSGLGGAGAESALLRIKTQEMAINDTTVYAVGNITWDELEIDGTNEPNMGAALDTIAPIAADTWHEFDVSAHVTGDGTYSFGMMTTQNDGQLDWQSKESSDVPQLIVTAAGGNMPPAFVSDPIGSSDAMQDAAYSDTIAGSAVDPNGDDLVYSAVSGPGWLSIDPDGGLSGVPGYSDIGVNSWTVEVSDGRGGIDTATLNITVEPLPNTPPYFTADPFRPLYAIANVSYHDSIGRYGLDDQGDAVSYYKLSGPDWLGISIDGYLSGTAGSGDVGVNAFSVRIEDANFLSAEAVMELDVRANADVDGDGRIDNGDLGVVSANMGALCSAGSCPGGDIDGSGVVGPNDVRILAGKWLDGPGRRPNIVLMLSDDVSPDLYGCYGNTVVSTPNIDEMAQSGVMFRTAWATAMCAPTRAMIMSGRYASRTGYYYNGVKRKMPDGSNELFKYHHTFSKLLKQAGYATAIAGKWHNSSSKPESLDGGFDEYCLWSSLGEIAGLDGSPVFTGAMENDDTPSRYWHPGIIQNHVLLDTEPNDFGPDIFCDFMGDFIERKSAEGKPVLAYWSMAAPHGTRQGVTTTPHRGTPGDISKQPEPEHSDRFRALNEYIDFLIGRLRQRVADLGLDDNTIYIYCSDNGTAGTAKTRGVERGCRVVYVVDGAGIKQRGATDEITDFSDVFPTLLDFGGAELPEGYEIDGKSLKPFLTGETDSHRDWIYSYIGTTQLIRDRRYMLEVLNPILDVPTGRLYDCGTSRDGVGYVNITNMPEGKAKREEFAQILSPLPPLEIDDELFSTTGGASWLTDYVGRKDKHIHNHADYVFYDEEIPLVAGDVALSGGGNVVSVGSPLVLAWDTSAVAGLAGNEAGFTFGWWRDGMLIATGSGTALTIDPAALGDAGEYTATATDGVTTFVSLALDIVVVP